MNGTDQQYLFKNYDLRKFRIINFVLGEDSICEANIVPLYECYLNCLEDYTLDRRGDIGAWVREAAMTGLAQLTLTATSTDPTLVPEVCIRQVMPR